MGHGCVLPLFTVSEWGDPARSVLAVPICTAVVVFDLTQIISVFFDGITIYGTVLVSLERACLCHVLQAGHGA